MLNSVLFFLKNVKYFIFQKIKIFIDSFSEKYYNVFRNQLKEDFMNTKKIVVAVVCALCLFSSVFAGGQKDCKKLLGVVTPAADHGFTAESIRHCEAEVKHLTEKYGFDYRFMTAAESGEQSNAVETILAMKPDAFVL